MWLGSLSYWNVPLLPSFWRLGVIISASILVYPQAFMVPSLNVISPRSFGLAAPYHTTYLPTLPPCFTVRTIHSLLVLARFMLNMLDPGWAEQMILVSSDQRMCSQYSSGFISWLFFQSLILQFWDKQQAKFSYWRSIGVDVMQCPSHVLSCHRFPLITLVASLKQS